CPVDGLGTPRLAVWKGDQGAACVAAASVIATVTRDRIMRDLDKEYPEYGFADHKGYCTAEHQAALVQFGACPEHRFSYANVAAVAGGGPGRGTVGVASPDRLPVVGTVGENDAMFDVPGAFDEAGSAVEGLVTAVDSGVGDGPVEWSGAAVSGAEGGAR
ncbi:MAG TPA: hypothetical protein VHA75_06065, partial [Rugosimonospora sp.]|nr:hypothetical protein [Rugosimonospora sp.]